MINAATTTSTEKLILFIRPENNTNKFIIVQPDTMLVDKISALNLPGESLSAYTLNVSLLKANKEKPFTKIADNYINDVITLRNNYFNTLQGILFENISPENPVVILQNAIAEISGKDITNNVFANINMLTKQVLTLLDKIRIQYREFTTSNQFESKTLIPSNNYKIHNGALDSILELHTKMVNKYIRLQHIIDNEFAIELRNIFAEIKNILTNMQTSLKDVTKENYLTIYELNRETLPQNTEARGLIIYIESINKNGKFENMFKIIHSNADIEQAVEQRINNNSCDTLFNMEFYQLLNKLLTEWNLVTIPENYIIIDL